METRSIYDNISPLDHRYYESNRELFDALGIYLNEHAAVRYATKVECSLLATHLELRNELDADTEAVLNRLPQEIDPSEVYEEERTTQHNVRALVNVIARRLPDHCKPFLHKGATSVDILDTAAALRYRDAVRLVLAPLLADLVLDLAALSLQEAETPQIGRTHGQHAVPITFGFAVAEYTARLGKSVDVLLSCANDLRGKLAGAVGAYNATSLLYADPEGFERRHLARLGIQPAEYSTQMVEPEYLLRMLQECNVAFGIIANLADDLRHLQRSEIGELREHFGAGQVGSSTMPQKRNPWNSEHVKSLWKAFSPRIMTYYMDQISEHQRDLSNSASARFIPEYIAGLAAAASRMRRILAGVQVDRDAMQRNLRMTGPMVLAEAAYILLAEAGFPDGHERVRRLTLESEERGLSLSELLAEDPKLSAALSAGLAAVGAPPAEEFFSRPENYTGRAAARAREIAKRHTNRMETLKKELNL